MNRPERPNYSGLDLEWSDYIEDLEKYCDVIEKSLDKACVELQNLEECFCSITSGKACTIEQWKELCLRDE